jgi:multidrug efflux pump
MDISHFFIDRPRFAAVLSILVFLVGLIAIFKLPISEYPEVTPPQTASITCCITTARRPPTGR